MLRSLTPAYWQSLAVVCLLYVARFDTAFITVRASSVSCPRSWQRYPLLTPTVVLHPFNAPQLRGCSIRLAGRDNKGTVR